MHEKSLRLWHSGFFKILCVFYCPSIPSFPLVLYVCFVCVCVCVFECFSRTCYDPAVHRLSREGEEGARET